jgi:hypothetical protein
MTYVHTRSPVSNRSSTPGKPITEEQLNCTPDFTGKIVIRISGGREKTVTGGWAMGPISGKVPSTTSGTLPAGIKGSPSVGVEVPGTLPYSYLPKITVS